MSDWRARFFRSEIFSPGQPEAVARAAQEASFIWRSLKLKKGARVLDVCCGTGRHSAALARRGADVVGVDATPEYLREARKRAGKRLRLLRGDMRRLPFAAEFDAAINLWTSFGYFERPGDDLKTLRSIRASLKPGGLFLIDLMNAAWLRKNFQPAKWQRRGDGSYLLEDSRFLKGRDPRVESEWTILRRHEPPVRARLMVRQYDLRRLSALLRRAGFEPLRSWGGFDGSRLSDKANRLILLARRR